LTEQQRSDLAALAAMPDSAIDYGDAPELPDTFWAAAGQPLPEPKKQVTLRIDADVIEFFRHTGKRYQTRINAVLRAYVDAQEKTRGKGIA
jgi:uncharacterized protein (DUF4415 family)